MDDVHKVPHLTPVDAGFRLGFGWVSVGVQVGHGGLRDKPGTSRDYYHTCYCLSGLSTAQRSTKIWKRNELLYYPPSSSIDVGEESSRDGGGVGREEESVGGGVLRSNNRILGGFDSLLEEVHPLCNVRLDRYKEAREYFCKRPFECPKS